MAFSAAAKQNINTSNKESKGMSLLLVFFHGGDQKVQNKITNSSSIDDHQNTTTTKTTTRFIRRTTSSTLLSSKAQSTISICVLLVLITLLLFTLSTFEPSPTIKNPRRVLSRETQFSPSFTTSLNWFTPTWDNNKPLDVKQKPNLSPSSFALQKMGTLYRRGTNAMNDLIVGHVVEDVSEDELRLFLRTLHRSGLTSKADIVFLFGSVSLSSRLGSVIREENDSFLKLIRHYKESNNKGSRDSVFSFESTQFWKSGKKDAGETIWGKKSRGNFSSSSNSTESTRLTYGSVVGFDANELDPENSLGGFLDHVQMSFRKWACYPMLLGRIRRNFKHIMLLDVKSLMLLSDPLGRVRNRSPESIYLVTRESSSGKHSKRNSDKTQSHFQVNSAILMGGARGIRRLADAMLTDIVRATMQHKKKKNTITESEILSQLVGNGHVLKNIDLITSTEWIQEASSLMGPSSNSAADYSVVRRGNSNHDLNSIIMKLICLCETNSYVYRDC